MYGIGRTLEADRWKTFWRATVATMYKQTVTGLARAAWLRDPLTIEFDRRVAIVLVVLGLLAMAGIIGRFHQSSIDKWNDYLNSPNPERATLLGEARGIRSDEWLVGTPWMLSQLASRQPEENRNIGGQRSPLLTSVPVSSVSGVLQPEFWGFALFGREHGFSWLWMYRLFGLLAAWFLLLQLLTRGDMAVSATGAVAVCFASFTQWWFSTNLPEILIGTAGSILGFAYIWQSRTQVGMAAGALLLFVAGASFAFQLYPPFQVVCVQLGLAIAIGLAFERDRRERAMQHFRSRVSIMAGCLLALGAVFYRFWLDAAETITALTATSYPGQRTSVGGSESVLLLMDGIFEAWRIGEASVPLPPSNPSEAANFALLFPVVALAALIPALRAVRTPLVMTLLVYCIALAAWAVAPLPEAFAVPLAKLTLLSFSTPHRALLGIGLGSVVLVAVWISSARRLAPLPKQPLPIVLGVSLAATLGLALAVHQRDPAFFTLARLVAGGVIVGLASWAVSRGRLAPWAIATVLLAIPAATVNPLARGLAPLTDRVSMQLAVKESRAADRGVTWMVVGSFVLPQALKANGIPTFGGATYLPAVDRMRLLDPDGSYSDIWNRYAHIQVNSEPGVARPRFTMIDAPGLYAVSVDVCSRVIALLGITHVVYASEPPPADRACLSPIGPGPVDGVWMFRYVPAPSHGAGGIEAGE